MNLELKKIVNEKLEDLHKSSSTINVLYDAIENCSNEDFTYHRDIVFDMFNDNENLIKEENGKWFYSYTDVPFDKQVDKTKLDELLEGLLDDDLSKWDLSDVNDIKGIKDWVEIDYKRFVFFFFTLCLKRLDLLNETIEQY